MNEFVKRAVVAIVVFVAGVALFGVIAEKIAEPLAAVNAIYVIVRVAIQITLAWALAVAEYTVIKRLPPIE